MKTTCLVLCALAATIMAAPTLRLQVNDSTECTLDTVDGAEVTSSCDLTQTCTGSSTSVCALKTQIDDVDSRLAAVEAKVNTLQIAVGAAMYVGHCVDAQNNRPQHCYTVTGPATQQACRDACYASNGCTAYEWGQRDGANNIYCQLVYVGGHNGVCPDGFTVSSDTFHPHTGNDIVNGQGPTSGATCHLMPQPASTVQPSQEVCELTSGVSNSVSNGGTAGNNAYTAPGNAVTGNWYITMGQNVYSNGNFYWISNMFDGSNSCETSSTCSTRDRVANEHAHNCYMLMNGGCGGNDYIDVQLENPTYVSHVSIDPLYRGDSKVTSFRVIADGSTYMDTSTVQNKLSTINANRGFSGDWSKNGASGSSCVGDARWVTVEINAVVSTIRIGNIASSGHCGMGEIKLFGHGDC